MPTFEIESGGKTYEIDAPDQQTAIAALSGAKKSMSFVDHAIDFAKSIPGGMVKGAKAGLDLITQEGTDYNPGSDPLKAPIERGVAAASAALPAPHGRAGRVGEAVGEGVGNPLSYVGPGGALLKLGGAALSSAGSEVAGQAAEGTPYETPARIAGAVAGGAAAGKTLGPGAPKAAVPTAEELFTAGDRGYKAARNSGLELHPHGVSAWASKVEQELSGPDYGFTGGKYGTAPKTLAIIGQLQNPPTGATITAANLDTIRKNLRNISEETQPAQGGFAKATPDAKAAMVALEHLGQYTENIPQNHILAGNPQDYVRAIQQANGDWAAGSRVRDFDARLTKAENATDRQVAGSLDSQIRSKAGQMLDNPQRMRGMNDAEREQLQLINSGGPVSNTLRQVGRGGAGVIPIMGQIAAAPAVFAAGGAPALAGQAAIAAALYGARKGSEAITKSRAEELVDMLAKRSPEYVKREAALSPADVAPARAALVRALMNVH